MSKYLKDKKIIIYKKEADKTKNGYEESVRYIPAHPERLWAYVRQTSATEYFAAKAVQLSEEIVFVINHRPDITPSNIVLYNGAFYSITRIDSYEGYKSDLKIYDCKHKNPPPEYELEPY